MSLYKFKSIELSDEMNVSFNIRKKVFCEEQRISEKIEFDNLDHLCEHFLIYMKDEAIATARVRKKEDQLFKIERVAVLVNHRKLKVGSLLINKIIKYYLKKNRKSSIILHSQVAVEEFYKSLNFISYGEKFLEDGILHIAMKHLN
jgi:predicted GNAT family N-acyltransferase